MSVEAYMKNMLGGERTSNYEIMREQARESFAAMDMDEVSSRTGLGTESGFFRIRLLDRDYRVDPADGSVYLSDVSPAGSTDAMIIYDLLGYSRKGASPSGDYTQIQNLAGTLTSSKYAGQGMFASTVRRMEGRAAELASACENMGGVPWGKGDVAYSIPVYGELRAAVSFWDADEEFPASLNLLMDTNSLQYMHYETLWYLAGRIIDRLADLMGIR